MSYNNVEIKVLKRKLELKESQINFLKQSINNKNNALYLMATTLNVYLNSENVLHSAYFNELFNICHYAIKEKDILSYYCCHDDIVFGKSLIDD